MNPSRTSSERPLLSFAIPTYNRANCLDKLLDALLQQLHAEDRVEVIVSDNASTDHTHAVVHAYKARGFAIRYFRNEVNRGPDFNILQCYERAVGEYVWIFGDDDIPVTGTLQRILRALSLRRYDLVCVRSHTLSEDSPPNFTSSSDLELTTAEVLAGHVHIFFTFISGTILNKDRLLSLPHLPFDSLLGTHLVQLGLYYTALNHHRCSLLIRDPLIAATPNSHVGYGLYNVFGPTLHRITCEWLENESVRRTILNGAIQTFFPSFLVLSRISKTSSIQEDPHPILRSCFGDRLRYWIFDYPVCKLPLPLAKAWLLSLRAINKIDKLLGNPLLRS